MFLEPVLAFLLKIVPNTAPMLPSMEKMLVFMEKTRFSEKILTFWHQVGTCRGFFTAHCTYPRGEVPGSGPIPYIPVPLCPVLTYHNVLPAASRGCRGNLHAIIRRVCYTYTMSGTDLGPTDVLRDVRYRPGVCGCQDAIEMHRQPAKIDRYGNHVSALKRAPFSVQLVPLKLVFAFDFSRYSALKNRGHFPYCAEFSALASACRNQMQ